jgi:hypothetical protein
VDIVTVVSGGVSPQKRKQVKAQSSEIDVWQTCFRTMTDMYNDQKPQIIPRRRVASLTMPQHILPYHTIFHLLKQSGRF